MSSIIQLLPDSIANQIAAGEVVQRPASAVKELLENAIDAQANNIKLVVKEAGKSLIQVIDNGKGMSETDARMCFERHATSKIKSVNDLFLIQTMGFRGEALASIAAIAQVEMRTKPTGEELGTRVVVEGSEVKVHEPCQCAAGTTFSVKNLFYNVPARRNFLKSNAVEMRHILDEFQRVALAFPDISFSLHHNGEELYHLVQGNTRQRIVAMFGNNANKYLVPVNEVSDIVTIKGYVGKPEYAKKTRGEQFFFVNQRFIKSNYLHHAVLTAFEGLLPKETFPFYTLYLTIDPARIDVNVHPTKTEIKFEDERIIYNYLRVSIAHALGQYNIAPSIDFDQETAFSAILNPPSSPTENQPSHSSWTPTEPHLSSGSSSHHPPKISQREQDNKENWRKLLEGLEKQEPHHPNEYTPNETVPDDETPPPITTIGSQWTNTPPSTDEALLLLQKAHKKPYQIHQTYIISQIKSGFMLIDQQAAHERILYERYLRQMNDSEIVMQQLLFPKVVQLSVADTEMLKEILDEINTHGFDIQPFGKDTFVIHGVPVEIKEGQEETAIQKLLEQYKLNVELKLDLRKNLARSMAKSAAIKRGEAIESEQMQALIDELFACELPFKNLEGRNTFITFELDELDKKFKP